MAKYIYCNRYNLTAITKLLNFADNSGKQTILIMSTALFLFLVLSFFTLTRRKYKGLVLQNSCFPKDLVQTKTSICCETTGHVRWGHYLKKIQGVVYRKRCRYDENPVLRCLEIDFPADKHAMACNMFRGYRFRGNEAQNGERNITCNNASDSCQTRAEISALASKRLCSIDYNKILFQAHISIKYVSAICNSRKHSKN